MTEPAVALSPEEIANDAVALDHLCGCVCAAPHRLLRRFHATIAAKDAEIVMLKRVAGGTHVLARDLNVAKSNIAALEAKLADVLSMSTCTKCGLRSIPTIYPVGGGPEPMKLVYRCPNDDCGYCVPPPMSAKIEALEAKVREAVERYDLLTASGEHHQWCIDCEDDCRICLTCTRDHERLTALRSGQEGK